MKRSVALGLLCLASLPGQTKDPESAETGCSLIPTLTPEGKSLAPAPCDPFGRQRASAKVISAQRLAHKPSKAALKEFKLGSSAWGKSRNDEAIRHLNEAIRLDPEFVEAQVKLGAVYADSGDSERALAMWDGALALEPNWALIHIDRAAALLNLNRPEEAETAARRALRLEPGSVAASYILGCAMLMQDKITPETAAYLAAATSTYPRARSYLAQVKEYLAASRPGR